MVKVKKVEAARHGFGILKIIAAIFGVGVVLAAAYTWLNYSESYGLANLPHFQNSGMPVPVALQGVAGMQGYQASSAVTSFSSPAEYNVSGFTAHYLGHIYAQGSGAASLFSFNSGVNVTYSKGINWTRFDINATSVSAFGNVEVLYSNYTNGTQTCANFNITAVSEANQNGALFGSRKIRCYNGGSIAGIEIYGIPELDMAELEQFGVSATYSSAYQSEYNGMNCTYVSGNLTQEAANGTYSGLGVFGACISDYYHIPLSFSAIFSGNYGRFSLYVNETSISG